MSFRDRDKDMDRENRKSRGNEETTGQSQGESAGIGNNTRFRSTVRSLMYGLDSFVSAKTVLGEPTVVGDTVILPLVDVSFGVGAGAFGANTKNTDGNSGGALHGKMTPTAVLVVKDGVARVVNVKDQDMVSKIVNAAPGVVDRVSEFVKGKDEHGHSDKKKNDKSKDKREE